MDTYEKFKLVSKDDAATVFGVCVKTIDNYIRAGLLPEPVNFGGRAYWHPVDFQAFLDKTFSASSKLQKMDSEKLDGLTFTEQKADLVEKSTPVKKPRRTLDVQQRMKELNRGT